MSKAQRKSPRVEIALDVFLQTVDGDVPCKTKDISYEGVFIVQPDPLPLRKLIRFRTRLPEADEELQMLGLVAHTVNSSEAADMQREPGMGIQLFSLGRKTRQTWQQFVDEVYSHDPDARRRLESKRRPDVRVRIPDTAMLDRLRTVDLPSGELFVRTPELHPEHTEVDCVITHPTGQQEWTIPARVVEVVEGSIQERGIRLELDLPLDRAPLEEFLGGEIPDAEASKSPPAPPAAKDPGDSAETSAPSDDSSQPPTGSEDEE